MNDGIASGGIIPPDAVKRRPVRLGAGLGGVCIYGWEPDTSWPPEILEEDAEGCE